MSNEFFLGTSIPNPGTVEPLERKFSKDLANTEVIDFLKVYMPPVTRVTR
jgi:hypothetical protein